MMMDTKRTRVGIFVSSLQDMGGAVRVAVSMANRMADDYDVTFFASSPAMNAWRFRAMSALPRWRLTQKKSVCVDVWAK